MSTRVPRTNDEIIWALEDAINVAESDIQKKLDTYRADPAPVARMYDRLSPLHWQDSNGRYVLLDAYSALAQFKAAMR